MHLELFEVMLVFIRITSPLLLWKDRLMGHNLRGDVTSS